LSYINSSALSKRISLYLQVQVFWCGIMFIEGKVMDVTCTAITLIYLIICFLPFYVIVSFHFSLLFLYIFLSFFSPSPFLILPVRQRLYCFVFQFWGSPLLLHSLLAFSLHFPSDPPFHVIWLCLSSFSVVLQYLIDILVRLLQYLLLLKCSYS